MLLKELHETVHKRFWISYFRKKCNTIWSLFICLLLLVRYNRQELLSHYFYFQINCHDWWWHKFGFHNLPKIVVSVLVLKNPYQTTDTDWCWCAGQTEGRRRAWEETTESEKHRKKRGKYGESEWFVEKAKTRWKRTGRVGWGEADLGKV